jgi:hypothetical protein
LNYGFSWFSMIAIILGLEFSLGWFAEYLPLSFNPIQLIRTKI